VPKVPQDHKEPKVSKVSQGPKDQRVLKGHRDHKAYRAIRVTKAIKVTLALPTHALCKQMEPSRARRVKRWCPCSARAAVRPMERSAGHRLQSDFVSENSTSTPRT
jgi:hypothetical protein